MSQWPRAIQTAFSSIRTLPLIVNVTGSTTPVVLTPVTQSGGAGAERRVSFCNVGSALGGLVLALRDDPTGDTAITSQTIATAIQIPAGATRDILIHSSLAIGYVGATQFSIVISDL